MSLSLLAAAATIVTPLPVDGRPAVVPGFATDGVVQKLDRHARLIVDHRLCLLSSVSEVRAPPPGGRS